MSVHWPIIRRCLASPGRIAIVDDRRAYRAVELLVGAMHLADRIQACCSAPTVGILTPTSAATPIAALAAWMLGKVAVPLNYLLARAELEYVIRDCETDTLVTVGPMLDFLGYTPATPNLVRLDQLDTSGVPEIRWPAGADDGDLAVLLYTSGTSGRPKGVMLTHGNLAGNIAQVRAWIPFTPRDVMMGVLPQFHSFGLTVLTLIPLTAGMKAVYLSRFIPARLVRAIREHRPSVLVAIPSMYNALLSVKDAGPADFASLRYVVSGGEPLPQQVVARFRERFGVTIHEGYGLTETAPVTNWCRPHEWRLGSVGRALPGVIERIVDPATGRDLPPGRDGEVLIAGPNVMKGYFRLPAETAAAIDAAGFLHTGDMGRFDSDGHLSITGRIKEMLIIAGENVFPREIEEVLNRHPGVAASGVVGMADPIRGELPVGFVEMKEGEAFDEKSLQAWCRQHLAGYKVPAEIRRLDALPRNPTGKILRRQLKAMLAAAT